MRNLPTVLAAAALLIVLLLYMCSFQLRTTEVAVKRTFGDADPDDVIREPGLYWKWPWPIQSVIKYDNRLRDLVDRSEETRTADSKNIILTTFAIWTIADPYEFSKDYPDEQEGVAALRTKIRSHKQAVVGKHPFAEFVSTDPEERKLHEIEQEMMELVRAEAMEEFGVEVKMFGIKQMVLPEDVTKAVFDAMKKREENKARNYEAEGEAIAAEIEADAGAKQKRILAHARRKVDEINNVTQKEIGQIYKSFEAHQELRIFLDKLEALEQVLKDRTTLIFDTDVQPFDLFERDKRSPGTFESAGQVIPTIDRAPEAAGAD
jgi:membrane protease subunit HflC